MPPPYVITIAGLRPIPRFDELPWIGARIREAATELGIYSQIEDTLFPDPDADPVDPKERWLTTDQATIEAGGWYEVEWYDVNGATTITSVGQPVNPQITAADVRERTPTLDWEELGYPVADPDPLESLILDATAEFQALTGMDPLKATMPVQLLVNKALRMLVAYDAASGNQDVLETAADFDLIAAFGTDGYNETRRQRQDHSQRHPWPALSRLLGQILSFGSGGKAEYDRPGISVPKPDWNHQRDIMTTGTQGPYVVAGLYSPWIGLL